MQPKGTLTPDGAHATLVFHRTYRHAPENVWDAIATPEGLREWLMCTHAEIDGRAGGRIELVSGPARVLEYEWNVAPVPEMPGGERAIFRFELTANGDSTRLLVTYRRVTRQTARGFLPGLHAFLDRLEAQLDGRPLPDWMRRFGEVRADYPEWSEHAPPAGE
jgi:uncharacterized protein YndB with AHSA1/START domain